MTMNDLDRLAALIKQDRQALLAQWRQQVRQLPSARQLDTPTLNDHIPDLLEELVIELERRTDETVADAFNEASPPAHGMQRFKDGFDIIEIVAEYNILRGCLHDLADSNGLRMQGKPFHIVNRVLDAAIGLAVQTFATHQALEVQRRREEYLAFVAHDLRTPLNAISLAGMILELTLPAEECSAETSQVLKTLRRNVKHLEVLVAKVIDENANLQTEVGIKLEQRVLDLWPLVEALIHDLHPIAGTDSTRLSNRVPADLVVFADASLLRRVLQNLIANAIKYTPCGEVTIGARDLGAETGVECWISDNGEGIPEELLGKVFDKGETDLENPGGLGLGLAIVKTFVEAHGGKVSVESTKSLGSTFRFSLPAKEM